MQPARFTAHQRKELQALGLPEQSIAQIEADGLQWARHWLKRKPRRADVLAELDGLAKTLAGTRDAIERILNATEEVPHLFAARSYLPGSGRRNYMAGIRLSRLSTQLTDVLPEVQQAISALPVGPTRHQTASALPIKFINSSLMQGLVMAGMDPEDSPFMPSLSPTSKFRRVIGICYEAMGAATSDPERALRSYVTAWHEVGERLRQVDRRTERP